MRMQIEVTREDIANGKRNNAESCPIALAARRAGLVRVLVGFYQIMHGEKDRIVQLPQAASRFIEQFDAGEPVDPITFEIKGE